MKKMLPILCAAILAAVLSGCSFFNSSTEIIAVNLKPTNAVAIINGLRYEGTPIFISANRGNDLLISVYCAKYTTRDYVVRRRLNTTGVIDCVGGILIFPLFGLLSSGAWEFEENNLNIDLDAFEVNVAPVENPAAAE